MNENAQLATTAITGPQLPVDPSAVSADMIPFPTGRYAIPAEEMRDFNELKTKEQDRIKLLLSMFARMEAGGIVNTAAALGFQYRNLPGYSASSLTANYYKWQQLGWKGLIRKYNNGGETLPPEFVEHFRALCERNGRSIKQAMNALYRAWQAGESIPGFGTWREYYATIWPDRDLPSVCPGTPSGWGKSNLYTLQPSKAARALKTRGFAAMKAELPSLIRNPGKLLPLQLVVIDDFEIDQICYVNQWDPVAGTRIRAICNMAGVAAMDVATRRIIGLILKPRLPGAEGQKQAITRAEVRLLLYGLLRDYGVPAHGMTILAEKAAAAVTAELETTFMNLFGGRVAVTRTSTIDQSVLKSGFRDSGGKPWLKGWIESFFNLMHNVAAGVLMGQKGAHYLVKPADLEEKMRLTQRLIGTGPKDAQLSDEQLAKAQVPFHTPGELCDAYLRIFQWIEERTDHEMLGFDRVYRFREPGEMTPWQPWDNLANYTTEQQKAMIPDDRAESPRERWAKLFPRVDFAKVDPAALMLLLLTPKKATVKSRSLTFDHNKAGYTWIFDTKSAIAQLPQGSEVLVYFDPAHADHAHVALPDGRWIGEVKRWGGKTGAIDITSADQVTEAERQLAELYGSVLAEVRSRPLHQLEEAKLAEGKAINAALTEEAAAERLAAKPRELGITATLNRELPEGGATSATGEQLAGRVLTSAIDFEAQRKAAKTAAAAKAKAERPVPAQSASKGLADLVPSDGGAVAAPAPAVPDIAADDEGEANLNDLL